ncbi:MAG: hypothetical protein ACYTGK_04630 [Planctomycetota bacterium]|jgi:hypothetical protein
MPGAAALLARLERLRTEYGSEAARRKLDLLAGLERARLPNARSVERLHEVLCLWRAYPDDADVLAQVVKMLDGFERRPDLRRHRRELEDTGIAGTRIYFSFFPETAIWLARRWPENLHVDWANFEKEDLLDKCLQFLGLWGETPGLDEEPLTCRGWTERMKGKDETDAAFLMRRFAELPLDEFVRQTLIEELDLPLHLDPGETTPSRTRARASLPGQRIHFQAEPMARGRPDLLAEVRRPPRSVRAVSVAEGRRLIDLARSAMVTRSRDLDVFRFGNPADVRVIDCGDGLTFVAVGVRPERRLLLEAVYGFLTLKNGVPIGYVLNSALFGSAEIAYNVFETFRGAEAGVVYGHVVAAVRHLFAADTFAIYPYQLGDGNKEALDSGAWWFYQKIGFRPRDPDALRLMRAELKRMKAKPRHRSSIATLRELARHNVYFHLNKPRDDIIGELRTSAVGLQITDYLADRFGSDRARGERVCAREAAQRFGVRSFAKWSPGERLAWHRWGPLLLLVGGVERWSAAERRAAVQVVRAKGGRREADFAVRFDRHTRLRREILRLTRAEVS